MVNKLTLSFVLGVLVLATAMPLASAGWKELYVANHVLSNSNDYDIVWEGPYKDGRLLVTASGGKGNTALSQLDLNGDYDVVTYQKNDYLAYSGAGNTAYSSRYGHSPYTYTVGFNRYGSGYGAYNTNLVRDNSEYIVVDKTNSNILKDNQHARETALASQVIHEYHPTYNTQSGTWSWRY